jgi:nitrite reductase/ring-hydroxylating ferredoxin subunit
MSNPSARPEPICSLGELTDPGTREFSIGAGEWHVPGFLVRHGGQVRAYLNRCPHAGHLLNWKSADFFAPGSPLLLCNAHGALFEADTGRCVFGPCVGKSLQPVAIEVVDGQVLLCDPLADERGSS